MTALAIVAIVGWYAAFVLAGFWLIDHRYARQLERLNDECHDGWSETLDCWGSTLDAWHAADRRRETYEMDRRQM